MVIVGSFFPSYFLTCNLELTVLGLCCIGLPFLPLRPLVVFFVLPCLPALPVTLALSVMVDICLLVLFFYLPVLLPLVHRCHHCRRCYSLHHYRRCPLCSSSLALPPVLRPCQASFFIPLSWLRAPASDRSCNHPHSHFIANQSTACTGDPSWIPTGSCSKLRRGRSLLVRHSSALVGIVVAWFPGSMVSSGALRIEQYYCLLIFTPVLTPQWMRLGKRMTSKRRMRSMKRCE
jgi:hypothetical protein